MAAVDRCVRGALAIGVFAAIDSKLQLELEPKSWCDLDHLLRATEEVGEQVQELVAASVVGLGELGLGPLLRVGDVRRTFSALSVLWRASFNYGLAIAYVDSEGATVHVTDCPTLGEAAGQVHASWCLGVARLAGAAAAQVEQRRRPWAGEGDEQVVRVRWRGAGHGLLLSNDAHARSRCPPRASSGPRAIEEGRLPGGQA